VSDSTYMCAAAGYRHSVFIARNAAEAALGYATEHDMRTGTLIHVVGVDPCRHAGWLVAERGEMSVKQYSEEVEHDR
jgi:hypothetical protein